MIVQCEKPFNHVNSALLNQILLNKVAEKIPAGATLNTHSTTYVRRQLVRRCLSQNKFVHPFYWRVIWKVFKGHAQLSNNFPNYWYSIFHGNRLWGLYFFFYRMTLLPSGIFLIMITLYKVNFNWVTGIFCVLNFHYFNENSVTINNSNNGWIS